MWRTIRVVARNTGTGPGQWSVNIWTQQANGPCREDWGSRVVTLRPGESTTFQLTHWLPEDTTVCPTPFSHYRLNPGSHSWTQGPYTYTNPSDTLHYRTVETESYSVSWSGQEYYTPGSPVTGWMQVTVHEQVYDYMGFLVSDRTYTAYSGPADVYPLQAYVQRVNQPVSWSSPQWQATRLAP